MAGFVSIVLANWQKALIGVVVVVSAIIVIMGALKFLFNKINNKLLRKSLLAFTSVLLAMPATAIYFVSTHIPLDYYWIGYGIVALATVVTYWFYENTCLRELIQKVGSLTIGRAWVALLEKIGNKNNTVDEISSAIVSADTTTNARIPVGEVKPIATVSEVKTQKEKDEINKL